jgi:hypothetical protein
MREFVPTTGYTGKEAGAQGQPDFCDDAELVAQSKRAPLELKHDPEKWIPVFRRDHAYSKT